MTCESSGVWGEGEQRRGMTTGHHMTAEMDDGEKDKREMRPSFDGADSGNWVEVCANRSRCNYVFPFVAV
jgi:hypothetical protein